VYPRDLLEPSGVDERLPMLGGHGIRPTADRSGKHHRFAVIRLAGDVDVQPGWQVGRTVRLSRKWQYRSGCGASLVLAHADAEGRVPSGVPPLPQPRGSDEWASSLALVVDPQQL
jgi:hypothetical protein